MYEWISLGRCHISFQVKLLISVEIFLFFLDSIGIGSFRFLHLYIRFYSLVALASRLYIIFLSLYYPLLNSQTLLGSQSSSLSRVQSELLGLLSLLNIVLLFSQDQFYVTRR